MSLVNWSTYILYWLYTGVCQPNIDTEWREWRAVRINGGHDEGVMFYYAMRMNSKE